MRGQRGPGWGFWYGSWWMVQFVLDRTFSLGVHLDPCTRRFGNDGLTYGPYADLHLGPLSVSLGRHPARAWNLSLMRPEVMNRGAG